MTISSKYATRNTTGLPVYRAMCLLLMFLVASPLFGGSLPQSKADNECLYLLAGTPTTHAISGFPVRLYTVESMRLSLVRQVAAGLFSVTDDLSGHLYVLDLDLHTLTVIHEGAPEDADVVVSPSGNIESAVLPFSASYNPSWGGIAGPGIPPGVIYDGASSTLKIGRVFADAVPGRARVVTGSWVLYQEFRYQGSIGGPYPSIGVAAIIIDGNLAVARGRSHGSGLGILGPTPPFLPPDAGDFTIPYQDKTGEHIAHARGAGLIADSMRFFAFDAPPPGAEKQWPKMIYVLDKLAKRWTVIKVPAAFSPPRVFGTWLATTISEPNPEGRESPGLENERADEVDTNGPTGKVRELPRIRGMYPTHVYMPGKLLLQNLVDGREITIDTGQQDSEVLDVREDGLVLYRVNDEIFSAQIEGDKLSTPTLVVKGEDVPEVHWAFWSKAKVTAQPAAKPSTN